MLGLLLVAGFLLGVQGSSIDVKQNITGQGYPAEIHHVTTRDGYILELHRIPYGKSGQSGNTTRKVVLLIHSILAASNSFIYAGANYSIAFNLADAGCDVWMGNTRGNRYSRRHISLDPDEDKREFFDFNYEDIALLDLPAMMDYVLEKTKRDKLYYIGHTLGGTEFMVLNSMKNTYHSKIASAYFMAGIGYQKYFPHLDIKIFCAGIDVYYAGLLATGALELFPDPVLTAVLGRFINITIPYELVGGTSFKVAAQVCQNFRDKSFSRWNYGLQNLSKYGSLLNPPYDLSKIPIKVTMFYARDDQLLAARDVLDMVRDMPNAKAHRIARDDFNHLDYLASKDAPVLVNKYIIDDINKD